MPCGKGDVVPQACLYRHDCCHALPCIAACLQLKPGYDGVPKLVAAFERGIPHKVAADTQGKLVFFGHTEVGEHSWPLFTSVRMHPVCLASCLGFLPIIGPPACRPACLPAAFLVTELPVVSLAGMLNSVIELWRYPSAQACHDARKASRGVPEWRECIAAVTPGVVHFTSSFMQACPFSPMQ
jgi:hypothetical protein